MGAWGLNLISNDSVQDLLISIGEIIGEDSFADKVNNQEDLSMFAKSIKKNRVQILDIAIAVDCYDPILAFVGILKILKMNVIKKEMKFLIKALENEYNNLDLWSSKKGRKSYLVALENAVNNDTDYNFSMRN